MTHHYKVFPPKYGNVLIPTSSKRASLTALAMYSPSKWTGVWLQRLAWAGIQVFGSSVLPTKRISAPIEDQESWQTLLQTWSRQFGPFDDLGIYRPRNPYRKEFSKFSVLLMNGGRPQTFLKVTKSAEVAMLIREEQAQEAMWRSQPRWFGVMEPIGLSEVAGWAFLATGALDGEMHRPPRSPPLMEIIAEIQEGLSDLPKPAATPDHWVPIHGDFTPWNLRQLRNRELVLLDWEAARWGPPGSDLVCYEAARAVLNSSRRPPDLDGTHLSEARRFWIAYWSAWMDRRGELGGSRPHDAFPERVCRLLADAAPNAGQTAIPPRGDLG